MTPDRGTLVVAAVLLGLAAAPAAAYSWQNTHAPPDATGMGRSYVGDEPNDPIDDDPPGNGFASCGTLDSSNERSCLGGVLVLDSFYEANLGAANVDVNNIVNQALHGDDTGEYDKRMYPGLGYFGAYWGWWSDTGGRGSLQSEEALSDAPGVGDADAAIDDAHDRRDAPWDEFVWRGDNRWADEHRRSPHPGDGMQIFIQPGTWHNVIFQAPYPPPVFDLDCCGYLLRDDHDDGRVADLTYTDRTNTDRTVEDQGWVSGSGFPHINYDASLLVVTEARTAVNAPKDDGLYQLDEARALDADVYSSIHPRVAALYQATVWDTGDRQDGSDDAGPKDTLKAEYTRFALQSEDVLAERRGAATRPVSTQAGLALDAAGERPRAHEPNTRWDDYNYTTDDGLTTVLATHDPDTTYGALTGETGDYYEPGPDQDYAGYRDGEYPFLDIRPGYGLAAYPAQRYSFNVAPVPDGDAPAQGSDDRTAAPGLLSFRGNFGTWHDSTKDGFVGNLSEFGRQTSRSHPYRNGTVDDPNDYGDHASNHEGNPAKAFQWTPEWQGLCSGGSIEVTAVPETPDQRWGAAGAYVVEDESRSQNPYDDAVQDAIDDRSRHVREGPIEIPMSCDTQNAKEGEWLGDAYILLPAGNPTFEIRVTSVGTVTGQRVTPQGVDLGGAQVTDVDVIQAWT